MEVQDTEYHAFRDALRELTHSGRVILGARGALILPSQKSSSDEFTGIYRHNKRGFGFVVPQDPGSREDLYIPQGENGGAMTGDIVRAKITSRGQRDGKAIYSGRVTDVVQRTNKHFVGSLSKQGAQWFVYPDGNTLTEPIETPDAAARHIKPGTKVVVEITTYPEAGQRPQGVITEVLGAAGEKDVDLKSVIVQFNLPGAFPDEVRAQAREAVDSFDPREEAGRRFDLSGEMICTIDPDDAKDYDDAISLRKVDDGLCELGVHIADVSYFVPQGSPLDVEAQERGNSCYFPGHVIPMLPEILSNGVCSLQQGVPRLCKSVFITFDKDAKPVRAKFANTVIKSAARLRYREAQAILDKAGTIPHPEGPRTLADYDPKVVQLLHDLDSLAKRIQKRRRGEGQIVLDLPDVDLVLDDEGKVIGAEPEDESFTHTLIEMFMVEANEAVARLFDSIDVPFLRRIHPEPAADSSERLRHFVEVAGYKLPKVADRKALQSLLMSVKGKPEAFAINLAVLKSLSRAEYSPQVLGHYALASEHYCHYTSPIRRYADLMIHRLLDLYFAARGSAGGGGSKRKKVQIDDAIPYEELQNIGRQLSYTERRADDAERELRQIKILELLKDQIGEVFSGVVTGITGFGIFIQLGAYLVDGLIRYEDLMDDWWDVDERSGVVRGQRTGKKIGIGDVVKALIVKVDVPRRELDLAIVEHMGRSSPLSGADGKSKGGNARKGRGGNNKKPIATAKKPIPANRGGGGGRGRGKKRRR